MIAFGCLNFGFLTFCDFLVTLTDIGTPKGLPEAPEGGGTLWEERAYTSALQPELSYIYIYIYIYHLYHFIIYYIVLLYTISFYIYIYTYIISFYYILYHFIY